MQVTRTQVMIPIVFVAILIQVHLPIYFDILGHFDLALLMVIYIASTRLSVLSALGVGMLIGIVQDSLTAGPIGVFGILKVVTAYLTATVRRFIEVDLIVVRVLLTATLVIIHQLMFWLIKSVLLGDEIEIDTLETLILAILHAGIAILLFKALDHFPKKL